MVEKESIQFRLRKIIETRNYLLDETEHNDLMSKKYKETCKNLNYLEHFLTLASMVTGFFSISGFASMHCISVDITSSVIGIKICVITALIKNYKSVKKKKNNKHDKVVLLGKAEF